MTSAASPTRNPRAPGPLRTVRDGRLLARALVGALVPERLEDGQRAVSALGSAARLVSAAAYHRVPGYVLRAYGDLPVVAPVRASLTATVEEATARHLRSLADYRRVAAALDGLEVPHLVVKGPVLAEHHHGGPDLRDYRDLDLLVPGAHLRRVVDALESAGWPLVDRNWTLMREAVAGEVHLVAPFGTPVDLHWELLFRDRLRAAFPIPVEELFDRSRRVDAAIGTMPTLDAPDTLLHLCLHASLSGGHRLLWIKDVERAVTVDRPDWDDVMRRAHARRLGVPTALVLSRVRRSLGAPVPREVLTALLPSRAARAALDLTDVLVPPERSSSRGSPARLIAKSARGSGVESAREVARQLGTLRPDVLRLVRAPAARPDPGALLLADAAGAQDRDRYFQAVEALSGGVQRS